MMIVFRESHLSIDQFDPIEIADFTILTGVNGSGKSHLLDAISKKKVIIEGLQGSPKIVKFNFETFKLENEGAYSAQQLAVEREDAWNYFSSQISQNVRVQRLNYIQNYDELVRECRASGHPLWTRASEEFRLSVRSLFQDNHHIRGHHSAVGTFNLIQSLPYGLDEITKSDFLALYKPFATTQDFLPHALGKVIWDYYVKYRTNQVNEYQNEKHGKGYPVLTEDEFISVHGDKPWDVINDVLKKFETLDYRVSSPEGVDVFANFTMKLLHTVKPGLEIEFSSLSSGERVLMALVATIYKASSDNYFPDVLLLDELDASLHPSMIKNMLSVIQDVFLCRSMKVILVTHSPTTVALAPDDSVYLMNKFGRTRLEKADRQRALSILTEGFATLSEGMMVFDEIMRNPVSILTEGHNVKILRMALAQSNVSGVSIVEGIEAMSGKNQLKTLFDFISKMPHRSKVIFVWDCDASAYASLPECNNTYPFVLSRNHANRIAASGIENAFPEYLFADFVKRITRPNGDEKVEFDKDYKNQFAESVLARNNPEDFAHFEEFVRKVASLV